MDARTIAPVFVRGYSRSGGTLLVTLLDTHPNIAMSYEQYPNMLVGEREEVLSFEQFLDWLRRCRSAAGLKTVPKKFAAFVVRWGRSGISPNDLIRLAEGHSFGSYSDRLDSREAIAFIGYVAEQKRIRKSALRWGLKCGNQFPDYQTVYPAAKFLNITRDGRDVAASQLVTGAFNKSVAEIASGWRQTHLAFARFLRENPDSCLQIFYEELVGNPEQELRKICEFLKEAWDPSMLRHHEKDLTIFEVNHLSGERLRVPIDASKIGRWKKELTSEMLLEFDSVAGELLRELGYVAG